MYWFLYNAIQYFGISVVLEILCIVQVHVSSEGPALSWIDSFNFFMEGSTLPVKLSRLLTHYFGILCSLLHAFRKYNRHKYLWISKVFYLCYSTLDIFNNLNFFSTFTVIYQLYIVIFFVHPILWHYLSLHVHLFGSFHKLVVIYFFICLSYINCYIFILISVQNFILSCTLDFDFIL